MPMHGLLDGRELDVGSVRPLQDQAGSRIRYFESNGQDTSSVIVSPDCIWK
jgi:hypothetical protein